MYWKYRQRSIATIPLVICPNTPFLDTWSSGPKQIGWGVIQQEIVFSYSGFIHSQMMLSDLLCKIFLTGVSMNNKMLLCNLIYNSKGSHLHRSKTLLLDSIICSFVITVAVELCQEEQRVKINVYCVWESNLRPPGNTTFIHAHNFSYNPLFCSFILFYSMNI